MRSLEAEGVKTIFGYPGGAIMPVFDALYDYTRGEKKAFNHILVRHEQAAAHAAEGFARVSGEVGVCLVTSGPGVTNTLTGVADAMMDSTPIVVIAGQVGVGALGTDAFQEVDLVGLSQPITKWSYQIRRPEDVAWAVSRAFYIARSGRPGPVVLDFPKNAQIHSCNWNPVQVTSIRSYNPYPKISQTAVEQAAELINAAERPLALVGQGVELVLGYLRLESPSSDYVIRNYALDDIVRQAVRKFASQFIRRKLRLEYAPLNVSVITDEKWLLFVIEQVLSNALKYTRSGSVSITLEAPKTLCIRDTGIGIAPEDLPRVFEKGYTGCNGRTDKRATGIGLYLCRRILAKLGHSITIASTPGTGTTVRIGLEQDALEVE